MYIPLDEHVVKEGEGKKFFIGAINHACQYNFNERFKSFS